MEDLEEDSEDNNYRTAWDLSVSRTTRMFREPGYFLQLLAFRLRTVRGPSVFRTTLQRGGEGDLRRDHPRHSGKVNQLKVSILSFLYSVPDC